MNYKNEHKDIPGNPSAVKTSSYKLNDRINNSRLNVLSENDWSFWISNGYVVIQNSISNSQADETARFLWEFENKNPDDPLTWNSKPRAEMQMKELVGTGMVEAYNHQTLWSNRQSKKIYDAFVDIWGTHKLWVSIDRANLNFPISEYNENLDKSVRNLKNVYLIDSKKASSYDLMDCDVLLIDKTSIEILTEMLS